MTLSSTDLDELTTLAISAASRAGDMIADARPRNIEHKPGGASRASQVVTEVDRRSERLILEVLEPSLERFELGLLTEERTDDGSRFSADYFWSIDPLDGTLPYIEAAPGYAVSIALVARDGTPWIGVVHDPVESVLVHATRGIGAYRDGDAWSLDTRQRGNELSLFADRSLVEGDHYDEFIESLGAIARTMGLAGVKAEAAAGAVMNACNVLTHPAACYVKVPGPSGGGSVWDFAATACVFHELGAVATDVYGEPLDLNRADSSFMNHRGVLFATDEQLAAELRALQRN